jgi:hypothetical protein
MLFEMLWNAHKSGFNKKIVVGKSMRQIHKTETCFRKLLACFVLGLLVISIAGLFSPVQAQADMDSDGISDGKELELASLYLPHLQFKGGENFFPVEIEYALTNSILKLRSGETVTTVDADPTVAGISDKTADYFLSNQLGGLTEIAADYELNQASLGYTVYGQVKPDAQYVVVQYWFFYAYNDAPINEHEGDWEMIMILLDNAENPVSAVYSQHLQGQRAAWGDVEKTGAKHPNVYVARGSHANYFRAYQGKLGLESDDVGADGFALNPSDLNLVMLGQINPGLHPASQDWLSFGGRWGNWAELADAAAGFAGPYGPGQGDNSEKWYLPESWSQSVSAVDANWFTASFVASNFLLIFVIVTVVLSLWKIWGIIKLKRSGGLRLPRFLRSKASLGIALGVVAIVLTIGGMLLPWYAVRANIQSATLSTQGEADVLLIDGQRGAQVNLLVGGRGLSPAFNLQIPFGILLLVGSVLGILDIIGIKTVRGLGNKYLRGGITFIIIFIVFVLFIVQLASMIESLASLLGATLPPEGYQMAQAIGQQPIQGTQTQTFAGFGSVALSWGLGLGAYMILAAAIIKLIGGVFLRRIPELELNPEKEAEGTKK